MQASLRVSIFDAILPSVTAEVLIRVNLDNNAQDCFATLVQNFSARAAKFFARFARNDKLKHQKI